MFKLKKVKKVIDIDKFIMGIDCPIVERIYRIAASRRQLTASKPYVTLAMLSSCWYHQDAHVK